MLPENIVRRAVEIANENREVFDSTPSEEHADKLREIIEGADIVIGVWQEPGAPHGVGLRLIKGEMSLEEIVRMDQGKPMSFTAIPVREPEEAEAMRQVFGDLSNLH